MVVVVLHCCRFRLSFSIGDLIVFILFIQSLSIVCNQEIDVFHLCNIDIVMVCCGVVVGAAGCAHGAWWMPAVCPVLLRARCGVQALLVGVVCCCIWHMLCDDCFCMPAQICICQHICQSKAPCISSNMSSWTGR